MDTIEVFNGTRFPGIIHTQESLHAACSFQFWDTDVLLVMFPKSGTTGMQQVLSLIFCEGCLWPILRVPSWQHVPWLEHSSLVQLLGSMDPDQPRLFTSHLGAEAPGPALLHSKARVVYMAWNPKDVLISYHFHKFVNFLPDPSSFEDFVDEFLEGTSFYGSWFEHVKGWLGLKLDLNMFFITYKELHQEPRATLQKLRDFLGLLVGPEEEDSILEHCSFSFMSQSSMVNYSLVPKEIMDPSQGRFRQKGVTGDWKVHFSPEQNEKFNTVYQAKMGNLGLHLPWTMD